MFYGLYCERCVFVLQAMFRGQRTVQCKQTVEWQEFADGFPNLFIQDVKEMAGKDGKGLCMLFLAATKQLYEWFSPSVCLSVCLSVCDAFLAATKQLYEWYFLSVCPSVCLSVCHTFLAMFPSSYHHKIFRTYYQWQKWYPCKRSRSKVKGQGHRGHNPT